MAKLDKQALRLPTFAAGEEVLLSDGQRWAFRTPRVAIEPTVGQARTVLVARWTFGDVEVDHRFSRLMEGLVAANKQDFSTFYERFVVEVAIVELLVNYHLPRIEAWRLCMPRAGHSRAEVMTLIDSVTVATAIRAQELMRAAERTLPYQTIGDYRRLEPQAN